MRAREGPGRWLAGAILAGLLAGGVAVRAHGLARSLWLDEAWVANSVLEPELRAMFRPEAWLQTTPPLLLLLVRGAVALGGESNVAFRSVPALFSLTALGLFAALALRWLRRPAALAALALFAFSPQLALLGASLKPYASDAFAALALLAVGEAYLARPGGRRLALALAVAALLAPLCFAAPLFLPALLLAALPRPGRPARAPAWHAFAIAATGALASAALLLLFVLPNREPSLLEYFRAGFFPGGGPAALAAWLPGRLRLLFALVPGASAAGAVEVAAGLLGALGLADLARRGLAGEASALARALLLAAPIAGTLALNLAGIYPMARGNPRTLAFLLPLALLALGAGLEAFARAAAQLRSRAGPTAAARAASTAGWLALVGVLAGLAGAALRGGLAGLLTRPPEEDAEGAVAFLARETGADDLLYVHSSMRESFRLYARRATPAASRVVLGEVDWPCCPRGRPYRRDEDPAQAMPGELVRLAAAGARGRRLWVLVTDREAHFRQRGRRAPALLERGLTRLGCERTATEGFRGVRVDRYECAPAGGV
jgi:hypothetical protein